MDCIDMLFSSCVHSRNRFWNMDRKLCHHLVPHINKTIFYTSWLAFWTCLDNFIWNNSRCNLVYILSWEIPTKNHCFSTFSSSLSSQFHVVIFFLLFTKSLSRTPRHFAFASSCFRNSTHLLVPLQKGIPFAFSLPFLDCLCYLAEFFNLCVKFQLTL